MAGFNNMSQMEAPDYAGRVFLGVVVDNKDPEKQQRIRVKIPNVLQDDKEDLPWIAPNLHSDFGITADAGVMQVPVVDSIVKVMFQDGDVSYGMTVGFMHTKKYTPDPDLLVNYPNRRGWHDPKKNKFWIDMTEGSVAVHFEHPSGTSFDIDNDGNLTVNVAKDCTYTVKGDTSITTEGDTTITTSGDTKITTSGQTDIHSDGDVNVSGSTINMN